MSRRGAVRDRVVTAVVLWRSGPVAGTVEVRNGRLASVRPTGRPGTSAGDSFSFPAGASPKLAVGVAGAAVGAGASATLVSIKTKANPFSFFLRDVMADHPILVPEYGVAVTTATDPRSYDEIADAIRRRGLIGTLDRIEQEPEETYERAAAATRDQACPTWLGVGRDLRIFHVGPNVEFGYWGYVEPWYHSRVPLAANQQGLPLPPQNRPHRIEFCVGPGASCRVRLTRRLDEGVLPILHSTQQEEDVTYQVTAFATLETRPLAGAGVVRGSDWRAAYATTGGNMYTPDELASMAGLLRKEMYGREEEVVCCVRVQAANGGRVPRYAWFKGPTGRFQSAPGQAGYDGDCGFAHAEGLVFGIARLNGQPMPQREMAVLLAPGQTATLDLFIPHGSIDRKRASALAALDFDEHLSACREYWRTKLSIGASIRVPEPAIDERIRAGLLHCDLATLGRESSGPLLATIGWYSPIGSESSPIIQFFDSMGWHAQAERCLQFFLDRQRPDGFIQNFGGYQLETGGVLWTMGQHFRYTRDRAWVRRVRGNILRGCDYLIAWRDRNKRPELRGRGFGLADGKVADPEDFFHSFMLNALAYAGIARSAEMLADVDPASARRLTAEARAYRRDIRTAYREAVARAPVIPTGDGTWLPTAPPWTEYHGPLALYADGGDWQTHGAFGARDSLIGSLYLVVGEVFDADEIEAELLVRFHHELFTVRNAGLSQPYYCRHDYIHLARGEVKPFLKTYYNQFAALQDRQTYTFWEHYFHASQHKTHEEAWFLMQTRWMLWMERGRTLRLLGAVPRAWLADGQRIELDNVATCFGRLTLKVRSAVGQGRIAADIVCRGRHQPSTVEIRLPHPQGLRPTAVEGGQYQADRETVRVRRFTGRVRVTLRFPG